MMSRSASKIELALTELHTTALDLQAKLESTKKSIPYVLNSMLLVQEKVHQSVPILCNLNLPEVDTLDEFSRSIVKNVRIFRDGTVNYEEIPMQLSKERSLYMLMFKVVYLLQSHREITTCRQDILIIFRYTSEMLRRRVPLASIEIGDELIGEYSRYIDDRILNEYDRHRIDRAVGRIFHVYQTLEISKEIRGGRSLRDVWPRPHRDDLAANYSEITTVALIESTRAVLPKYLGCVSLNIERLRSLLSTHIIESKFTESFLSFIDVKPEDMSTDYRYIYVNHMGKTLQRIISDLHGYSNEEHEFRDSLIRDVTHYNHIYPMCDAPEYKLIVLYGLSLCLIESTQRATRVQDVKATSILASLTLEKFYSIYDSTGIQPSLNYHTEHMSLNGTEREDKMVKDLIYEIMESDFMLNTCYGIILTILGRQALEDTSGSSNSDSFLQKFEARAFKLPDECRSEVLPPTKLRSMTGGIRW